ncbi:MULTISPECIES: serine/arginine repetitive matrix protein 2 [unclassified Streptomyces]|uniref:serine/arginine repetitive matrix protein 2 n=1 Tax=unclassified Streptomyces TaxID=2593676 RepID=UPI00081DF962|nr:MULTISPECIES: serine/arginine repetitive matrix protein 2 [unclassified Streptomyces]MYR95114.1 serine/arginine repetitive matrix protein 2 [Streptomyces sp. SID4937]SCD84309.1 hypothetical protein GA0115243_104423 [Streptomyces sp. ScaeMP-e83]
MTGGGAVRWNDETQSWETEPRRAYTPPPPPPPSAAPVVPPMPPGSPAASAEDSVVPTVLPTVPDPYAETGPYVVQGPPTGAYNNITGTHRPETAARTVRERITPLTAGLAVAVLAAGAAALWFTVGGGGGGDDRDDARGRTASAPAEEATDPGGDPDAGFPDGTGDAASEPTDATATDTGTESPDAGDPPPGFVMQDDEEGFRIAVPEEWSERTKKTGGVFYEPFGSGELLQVFRVSEPGMTALEAVRAASKDRSVSAGFEEVRIGAVDNPLGGEAAELVYAYDSEDYDGRRRVLERVFTASDGRLYAVLVAAPDEQWPRHEEILATAVTHFDPYDSPF